MNASSAPCALFEDCAVVCAALLSPTTVVSERTATGATVVGVAIEMVVVGAVDVVGTVCWVGPTTVVDVVVVLGTVEVVEVEVVEVEVVDVVDVDVVEVDVVDVDVVEVDVDVVVVGAMVVVVDVVGGQYSPTPADADVDITAAAAIVSTPKITKRPANRFTPVSIRLRRGSTTSDRRHSGTKKV